MSDKIQEDKIQEVKIVNPLLERAKLPGESFTLPSLGLFYKNGELSNDVENGEIYLAPMVTLDEIILKSPDKLFSGAAIDDVFKRCCPQIIKPLELLAKDVDFILTALYKISFGNTSEIRYIHDCEKAKRHTYAIGMGSFINNTKTLDPTTITLDYTKKLLNGQTIKLYPPTFKAAMKIYQAALSEVSDEDAAALEKDVLDGIAFMIFQVDEITDKKMIVEWLSVLKPEIINEITNTIKGLTNWGTDFTSTIKCKDCAKEIDITSEINPISFFLDN